jgi:uncharacterized repeat protein (TIGR03803 family)
MSCVRSQAGARSSIFLHALVCATVLLSATIAVPQTYSVILDFTNAGDGAVPYTGLTLDAGGSLYGTATGGGSHGSGVVFKMKRQGATWVLSPIYSFAGGDDGASPQGRVMFGPDGALYGNTSAGGSQSRCSGFGCGTLYRLRPPLSAPRSVIAPWSETVVHRFTGGADGLHPQGDLTFDPQGNIYGTTVAGGDFNWGTIYKVTPAGGGWTQSVLFSARNDESGAEPSGGVVRDAAGNLYGTFQFSLGGYGTVFQLSPSGSGYTEQTIHSFAFSPDDGVEPIGGLIMDSAGHLFGTTLYGGITIGGGAVFEMSPGGGGWAYQNIYGFLDGDGGPVDKLYMDAAGNLYGTALSAGAFGLGSVFKLTPTVGGWEYTSLYDFCPGGFPCVDGYFPMSNVVIDAAGNLYGTASRGGAGGFGVVWKITP